MKHSWIKITQQVVDVIADPTLVGRFFAVDRPEGESHSVVGCDTCGTSMYSKSAALDCPGVDTEAPTG